MNTGRFNRDWDKLNQKMKSQQAGNSGPTDARFYKPKFNKDGTFSAIIRFLPGPKKGDYEEMSLIKKFKHYFNGPGGKYNEECLTTIGQQCPVCDENKKAWDAGNKQTARQRARVNSGIVNIIVINDPQSPECNGKVFLYEPGKRILEKINNAMTPSSSLVKSIKVFSYYEGVNFTIIGNKKKTNDDQTFSDYSDSKFDTTITPIGDDTFIEQIDKQLYSVEEFIAIDKFKSYNDLFKLMCTVLGKTIAPQNQFQNQQASTQPVIQPSQPSQPSQPQQVAKSVQEQLQAQAPSQTQTQPPIQQPTKQAPIQESVQDVPIDDMNEDQFFAHVRGQN